MVKPILYYAEAMFILDFYKKLERERERINIGINQVFETNEPHVWSHELSDFMIDLFLELLGYSLENSSEHELGFMLMDDLDENRLSNLEILTRLLNDFPIYENCLERNEVIEILLNLYVALTEEIEHLIQHLNDAFKSHMVSIPTLDALIREAYVFLLDFIGLKNDFIASDDYLLDTQELIFAAHLGEIEIKTFETALFKIQKKWQNFMEDE